MREAADQVAYPTSVGEVVHWFGTHYPKVKNATVRAHIKGLTDNDPSRHHFASLARLEPLFVRDRDATLARFVPPDALGSGDGDGDGSTEPQRDRFDFALEAFLEEFLLSNWDAIDWGRELALWESDDDIGHQYRTPVGRLDFLCRDLRSGALVVVELKRGHPTDRVVGQTARYMGWVRAQMADAGQSVEGIIVAHEQDERLAYAVSTVPDLSVLTYEVDFALRAP